LIDIDTKRLKQATTVQRRQIGADNTLRH